MLPTLQLGPLAIQTPGLMLLLGLWLGLSLAEKIASKRGLSGDHLYNLTFIGLIVGLTGARLGYVFQFLDAFVQSPLGLFSLNPGLLDPFSGFALGLLSMLVYGKRKNLPFWPTLDALTPVLAVLMIGVALAHVASGEAFGAETSLPWGIDLWGTTRHPAQFYELAAGLLILGILIRPMNATATPAGTLFLAFLALAAGSRLFLETFRGDSALILGGIRAAQLAAWAILAAALAGLDRLSKPGEGASHQTG